jgi:hypothetical protein
MSTFAETEIVHYGYRLPTKENKFRLPFQFSANNGNLPLLFSICSKQTEVAIFP